MDDVCRPRPLKSLVAILVDRPFTQFSAEAGVGKVTTLDRAQTRSCRRCDPVSAWFDGNLKARIGAIDFTVSVREGGSCPRRDDREHALNRNQTSLLSDTDTACTTRMLIWQSHWSQTMATLHWAETESDESQLRRSYKWRDCGPKSVRHSADPSRHKVVAARLSGDGLPAAISVARSLGIVGPKRTMGLVRGGRKYTVFEPCMIPFPPRMTRAESHLACFGNLRPHGIDSGLAQEMVSSFGYLLCLGSPAALHCSSVYAVRAQSRLDTAMHGSVGILFGNPKRAPSCGLHFRPLPLPMRSCSQASADKHVTVKTAAPGHGASASSAFSHSALIRSGLVSPGALTCFLVER